MNLLTLLMQVNIPSDETIRTALSADINNLALVVAFLAVLAILSAIAAAVWVTRLIDKGFTHQSKLFDDERTNRMRSDQEVRDLIARVDALERKLEATEEELRLSKTDNKNTHELLTAALRKISDLEKEINRLNGDLAAERKEAMEIYAENERLREENGSLKKRVDALEQEVHELLRKLGERVTAVENRKATSEQPVVSDGRKPESKIDTEPLTPKDDNAGG